MKNRYWSMLGASAGMLVGLAAGACVRIGGGAAIIAVLGTLYLSGLLFWLAVNAACRSLGQPRLRTSVGPTERSKRQEQPSLPRVVVPPKAPSVPVAKLAPPTPLKLEELRIGSVGLPTWDARVLAVQGSEILLGTQHRSKQLLMLVRFPEPWTEGRARWKGSMWREATGHGSFEVVGTERCDAAANGKLLILEAR